MTHGNTHLGLAALQAGLGLTSSIAAKLKGRINYKMLEACVQELNAKMPSPAAGLLMVLDQAGDDFKMDRSVINARNALILRDLRVRSIVGDTHERVAAWRKGLFEDLKDTNYFTVGSCVICSTDADAHAQTHTCTPSPVLRPHLSFAYARTATCVRARARAHTHTHTHTHKLPPPTFIGQRQPHRPDYP